MSGWLNTNKLTVSFRIGGSHESKKVCANQRAAG